MKEHAKAALIGTLLFSTLLFLIVVTNGPPAGKATTSSTVFIVNSTPANCTFDVGAGLNVVSLPCLSSAEDILTITNQTEVLAMYQYTPGTSDVWKVYNPTLPNWTVSDLTHLTRRAGYVVLMNASANKTIEGQIALSTDVPLIQGWNLVGYPSLKVRNISDTFGSVNATVTRVEAYNKTAELYIVYPTGNLSKFTPGLGYFVNVTASGTWTVQQ